MARTKAGIYIFRFIPPPGKGGGDIYWKILGLNMKGREKENKVKERGEKKRRIMPNFWKEGKNMIFDFGANMYPCNCNCMNH